MNTCLCWSLAWKALPMESCISQLAVCRELCGQGRRRLERPGEWKLLHRLLRRRHLLHLLRRSTPRLMRPSRRRLSSGGGRRESWLHSC